MTTPAPPARHDNVFTRKIGPLPMWGWLSIGVGLVLIYVIYEYRKKNQAAASTSSSTSTGTETGQTTGAGQVPQFVNQTNTYVAAPSASTPPPGNQAHKNWKGSGKPTTGTGSGSSPSSGGSSGSTGAASGNYSAPPGGKQTGSTPTTAIYGGQTLSSVLAGLKKQGYGVSGVSYAYQPVSAASISQYYSTPVYSVTTSGNTVAIGLE